MFQRITLSLLLGTMALDTGHFALEEDGERIASLMREFLHKNVTKK